MIIEKNMIRNKNSLVLDMPFVTLNKYINAERTNKYMASEIKRKQTLSVATIAIINKFKLIDGLHNVHFEWHKPNNREDHDNIDFCKKYIFDGLVKSGALKNDSPKYIGDYYNSFIVDKSRDYVWCVVTFIEM